MVPEYNYLVVNYSHLLVWISVIWTDLSPVFGTVDPQWSPTSWQIVLVVSLQQSVSQSEKQSVKCMKWLTGVLMSPSCLPSACGALPPITAQTTQWPGCCPRPRSARCPRPAGGSVGVSSSGFFLLLFLFDSGFHGESGGAPRGLKTGSCCSTCNQAESWQESSRASCLKRANRNVSLRTFGFWSSTAETHSESERHVVAFTGRRGTLCCSFISAWVEMSCFLSEVASSCVPVLN